MLRYYYLSYIVLLLQAILNDLSRYAFSIVDVTIATIRFYKEWNVAVSGAQLTLRSIERERRVSLEFVRFLNEIFMQLCK